jgi:hypothetical protein
MHVNLCSLEVQLTRGCRHRSLHVPSLSLVHMHDLLQSRMVVGSGSSCHAPHVLHSEAIIAAHLHENIDLLLRAAKVGDSRVVDTGITTLWTADTGLKTYDSFVRVAEELSVSFVFLVFITSIQDVVVVLKSAVSS